MHGKPLLLLSLLAAALLAGCSDGSDPKDEPTDDLGLEATEETGIVRGIVFDDSIVPLPDVLVTLRLPDGTDQATRSREDGAFGFEDLEPGTYFLRATHLGYVPTQQSVDVVAGEDEPDMVRLRMERDPEAVAPYAVTYVFEGFIECSSPVFAACGFVTDVGELGGVDNATAEDSQVRYALEGVPTWVQSEMVWDPTNELGRRLALLYSWDCGDTFLCDHDAYGESPLLLAADPEAIAEIGLGNSTELYIRVFSDGLEESDGLAGATLEQAITIYSTVFYGYAPPEGWRFTETQDEPEPPQA